MQYTSGILNYISEDFNFIEELESEQILNSDLKLLFCKSCGAQISLKTKECNYCGNKFR